MVTATVVAGAAATGAGAGVFFRTGSISVPIPGVHGSSKKPVGADVTLSSMAEMVASSFAVVAASVAGEANGIVVPA